MITTKNESTKNYLAGFRILESTLFLVAVSHTIFWAIKGAILSQNLIVYIALSVFGTLLSFEFAYHKSKGKTDNGMRSLALLIAAFNQIFFSVLGMMSLAIPKEKLLLINQIFERMENFDNNLISSYKNDLILNISDSVSNASYIEQVSMISFSDSILIVAISVIAPLFSFWYLYKFILNNKDFYMSYMKYLKEKFKSKSHYQAKKKESQIANKALEYELKDFFKSIQQ